MGLSMRLLTFIDTKYTMWYDVCSCLSQSGDTYS